jgi:hypothetical protein
MDRITHVTKVPLQRLVDWKNRAGDPFELRCVPTEGGTFRIELNTPQPTTVESVVPIVHGDYESRKEEDGSLVYKALPGNTMGQAITNDGRPAFGVAYDVTELDPQGRPLFKVYFGSASEWFVKNQYHAKWNDLRDVRRELEPDAAPPPASDEPRSKEAGRNPRDVARSEQREHDGGRHRRGRRGGRGRGRGGGPRGEA